MNDLAVLRRIWLDAEKNYKTAKTSLDGSLEYILAREELKQARFIYNNACKDRIEELYFSEEVV